MSMHTDSTVDGLPVVRLANAALEVIAAPGVGGRIISLRDRAGGRNLLWRNREQTVELACHFDPAVFPCCWLFATFGQLDGLYTAVIEPANLAALSVADAVQRGACPTLAPRETVATRITLALR